ncbi:hypothetical protein O0Q50_30625 [Priestia aryabhattai]|uniref:Uncharacterized protein n=1 Tax=Priestia aryabhattai TaxID=412384 RepID=A0AAX6NIR2_PRIAR|nr:hypothetical protein [Priestia aryabhattai]MDU9695560.1 hypothetical protein [Priestia aryabhattai]
MKTNVKNGKIFLGKIDDYNSEVGRIGGFIPSESDFTFTLGDNKVYLIKGETNKEGFVERIVIEVITYWCEGMKEPRIEPLIEIDADDILECENEGKL